MRTMMKGLSVRVAMLLIILAAALFGIVDQIRERTLAEKYRRKAASADAMARECRRIVALDEAARLKESGGFSVPLLDNPEWTRRMIPYFEFLKQKYEHAAANPREQLIPDPDYPD